MIFLGVILLVALMIPVVAILVDSPIGRALGRRLEGPEAGAPGLADLAKKVELLEGDVSDLSRSVDALREENQFLQKLLEDGSSRPSLPPRNSP
ncbi:MAG: hypothetical protein ABI647_10535 [Gemmatimonadota bacterium]